MSQWLRRPAFVAVLSVVFGAALSAVPSATAQPTASAPTASASPVGVTRQQARSIPGKDMPLTPHPTTGLGLAVGEGTGRAHVVLGRGPSRAGSLPLTAAQGGSDITALDVEGLGSSVASSLGGRGLAFSLSRTDGGLGAGQVDVTVDYSGMVNQYGADFGLRLKLATLPACALQTPDLPECQVVTPLKTAHDINTSTMTARVSLPAGSAGRAAPRLTGSRLAGNTSQTTVLVAAASTSSEAGNWGATDLRSAMSWATGTQSGSFTYSYPISLPAAPAGPTPSLSLDYDSGSVDGLSESDNTQASVVGSGWSLSIPYIERRYKPCPTATTALCWDTDNATIVMNGVSGVLSKDASGLWHPETDQGWKIEKLTVGTTTNPNDDVQGSYWRVIDAQGMGYWFGLEAFNSAASATSSTLTVPVTIPAGTTGAPCTAGTTCTLAYRWNLAYIEDPNGNVQSYEWIKKQARYSTTSTSSAKTYDAYGLISVIRYGQRGGSMATDAAYRVRFLYDGRCTADPVTGANTVWSGCPAPTDTYASFYPDTPFDQWCGLTQTVCSTGPTAPTFFLLHRLYSIQTEYLSAAGTYSGVDTYDLAHTFPSTGDGTSPALYLADIRRTGVSATPNITLPVVLFNGVRLPNRAEAGFIPFNRWRVDDIKTEMGGRIQVVYSQPDACDIAAVQGHADTQTTDCFPAWTTVSSSSGFGWFNKYLVQTVTTKDLYGSPDVITTYTYSGGAGWHHMNDAITPWNQQSWSDYRGYAKVTSRVGTGPTTERQFFRGMNGDRLSSGATKSVTITPVGGTAVTDQAYLRGQELDNRLVAGGIEATYDLNAYWANKVASAAASTTNTSYVASAHDAYQVRVGTHSSYLDNSAGSRLAPKQVGTQYDTTYGLPISVTDYGDPISGIAASCSYTLYNRNTTQLFRLISLPSEVRVHKGACPAGAVDPQSKGAALMAKSQYFYDGSFTSTTVAPVRGLLQRTLTWRSATETVGSATSYDALGRAVSSIQPDNFNTAATTYATAGAATTTQYTAATTGGPTTRTTVTNPLGHATLTDLSPSRGQPTGVTTAAGLNTQARYDALGRLVLVRKPGYSYDTTAYTYSVSDTTPSRVGTSAFTAPGVSLNSYSFVDALGRTYETQTEAPNGTDIMLSGRWFDSRGNANAELAPVQTTGVALGTAACVSGTCVSSTWKSRTATAFNLANRPSAVQVIGANSFVASTTTMTYDGALTTVTPPQDSAAGGTDLLPTVTRKDYAGRVSSSVTGSTSVLQTYDELGRLLTLTTTAPTGVATAPKATYGYDWVGNRTSTSDPDAGTSTTDYYPSGAVKHTKNAVNVETYTTIDQLSRPLATYAGSSSTATPILSSKVYDGTPLDSAVAMPGFLTSETSYEGSTAAAPGNAYTTSFGYDTHGRVTTTSYNIPASEGTGLAGTYAFTQAYDDMDRPTVKGYPAAGGLAAESVSTNWYLRWAVQLLSDSQPIVGALGVDSMGRVVARQMSNGSNVLNQNWAYDPPTGRLTAVAANVQNGATTNYLLSDYYNYYPSGNPSTKIDDLASQRECFAYDSLNRLTSAYTGGTSGACAPSSTGPAPYNDTYAFDNAGNMTSSAHNGVTTTYTYGTQGAFTGGPHAVTKTVAGTTTNQYAYNAAGQQTRRVAGGVDNTLVYDAQGRMTSIAPTAGGASSSSYVDGPDGSRWIRRTLSETVLYLGGQEVHRSSTGVVTAKRYYDLAGDPVAMRSSNGTLTWLMHDGQGTQSLTIDATTGIASRDRYLPYGGNRGTSFTAPTDRGWLGQTRDTDTGLLYLNARYYDPVLQHFLAVDPLLDASSATLANPYLYGNGNPASFTDPSGLYAVNDDGDQVVLGGTKTQSRHHSKLQLPSQVYTKDQQKLLVDRWLLAMTNREFHPSDIELSDSLTSANRFSPCSSIDHCQKAWVLAQSGEFDGAYYEAYDKCPECAVREVEFNAHKAMFFDIMYAFFGMSASGIAEVPSGAAKAGPDLIRARDVRFTQDSAGATFKDGRSVFDLADEMSSTGGAPSSMPAIRIFEKDGNIHSLDNRRLFAGQYADVSLPYVWATPGEIAARNQTQIFGGTSIVMRMGEGVKAWWQP